MFTHRECHNSLTGHLAIDEDRTMLAIPSREQLRGLAGIHGEWGDVYIIPADCAQSCFRDIRRVRPAGGATEKPRIFACDPPHASGRVCPLYTPYDVTGRKSSGSNIRSFFRLSPISFAVRCKSTSCVSRLSNIGRCMIWWKHSCIFGANCIVGPSAAHEPRRASLANVRENVCRRSGLRARVSSAI